MKIRYMQDRSARRTTAGLAAATGERKAQEALWPLTG